MENLAQMKASLTSEQTRLQVLHEKVLRRIFQIEGALTLIQQLENGKNDSGKTDNPAP